MKHLDLFSGIGGFALAARWAGIETVGFCEIEEYPRKVLEKNFPGVPIHHDIKELDGNDYAGIDIVTGGYPCQPFSLAGKREGHKDDRHLWPEMLRVIKQARPSWVVAENVAGHITMGLDQVLSELEAEGYATTTLNIPACAVDAHHKRARIWVIANSNRNKLREQPRGSSREKGKGPTFPFFDGEAQPVADSASIGRDEKQASHPFTTGSQLQSSTRGHCSDPSFRNWIPEPGVGRVVNGLPNRVDRIKGLGNAIVPQVAFQILSSIKKQDE